MEHAVAILDVLAIFFSCFFSLDKLSTRRIFRVFFVATASTGWRYLCFYSVALENKTTDLRLHNRRFCCRCRRIEVAPGRQRTTAPCQHLLVFALHTGWCKSKFKQRRHAIGSTASATASSCMHSRTAVPPATIIISHIIQTNSNYKLLQSKTTCATPACIFSVNCVGTRCCIYSTYGHNHHLYNHKPKNYKLD